VRRLPGPAGCRLSEGDQTPEAPSNCFGTGREHKLNLLRRPYRARDSKWMSGSAKAGTTAERHTLRAAGPEYVGFCALLRRARQENCFFS